MGQICDLLKISFSAFWRGAPKCTETDLKKSPKRLNLGDNLTSVGSRLGLYLADTDLCRQGEPVIDRRLYVSGNCVCVGRGIWGGGETCRNNGGRRGLMGGGRLGLLLNKN